MKTTESEREGWYEFCSVCGVERGQSHARTDCDGDGATFKLLKDLDWLIGQVGLSVLTYRSVARRTTPDAAGIYRVVAEDLDRILNGTLVLEKAPPRDAVQAAQRIEHATDHELPTFYFRRGTEPSGQPVEGGKRSWLLRMLGRD